MRLNIKQLRWLIREEIEKVGYSQTMDKQLKSFSQRLQLHFFSDVEEINNNFEGFLEEFPGVTSIAATPDFHDFFIVGLVKDGQLYRLGDEDFNPDEDPSDLIPVTFDELESFYTTLFPYKL